MDLEIVCLIAIDTMQFTSANFDNRWANLIPVSEVP